MDEELFRIVGPEGVVAEGLPWEDAFALKIERRYDERYRLEPDHPAGIDAAPSPEETPPAGPIADRYRVRSGPGKILGPLPRAMIVDLIIAGRVEESAEVAPDDSDDWRALAAVPQFNAALHERTALGLRPGWVQPKWSRPLDERGLAPFILELAHGSASGWLRVEGPDGARAGIITIAQGRVVHARAESRRIGDLLVEAGHCTQADVQRAVTMAKDVGVPVGVVLIDLGLVTTSDIEIALVRQADLRLRELFLMTQGTARFEENAAAEGEDPVFDTPPVQLVRDLYRRAGALFIDAALRGLIREDVEVVARDARWWSANESELSDTELMLLTDLGRPGPLGPALLAAQEDAPELEVAMAALLLVAARCVSARKKGATPELEAMAQLLEHDDPFTALDVGPDASKVQIQLAVERLRAQVRLVGESHPEPMKIMLKRCDAIEAQLTDPVERYILARAAELGLDPRDAGVRGSLLVDHHREGLEEALRAGKGEDARAHSRAWRKLEPKDALCLAGQARVYIRFGSDAERKQGLTALMGLIKRFPEEPRLHLALAEAALDFGDPLLARQQVGRALSAGASPSAVAAIDARLEGDA